MTDHELVAAAWKARDHAVAPHSGYAVGAALLTPSKRVFTGVNVESSTYGLSICAERVALFKALSEGEQQFIRLAIAARGNLTPVPCGACCQLLSDFTDEIELILSGEPNKYEVVLLSDLYPRPFKAQMFR